MSLYAANNICKFIPRFSSRDTGTLAGIVGNDRLNKECEEDLIEEERYCRKEALLELSHSTRTEQIRGLPVAVFGEWDFVASLSRLLEDYLGCHPVLLGRGTPGSEDIKDMAAGGSLPAETLFNPDADQAMEMIREMKPAILFGSSFEQYMLDQMDYAPKFFVQTTMPSFNRTNLVYRPNIGFSGALTFIDAILHCQLTPVYPYSDTNYQATLSSGM